MIDWTWVSVTALARAIRSLALPVPVLVGLTVTAGMLVTVGKSWLVLSALAAGFVLGANVFAALVAALWARVYRTPLQVAPVVEALAARHEWIRAADSAAFAYVAARLHVGSEFPAWELARLREGLQALDAGDDHSGGDRVPNVNGWALILLDIDDPRQPGPCLVLVDGCDHEPNDDRLIARAWAACRRENLVTGQAARDARVLLRTPGDPRPRQWAPVDVIVLGDRW